MTLIDIIDTYTNLLGGQAVSVLISIAFVIFLFNVIRYFIVESGNDKGREKARRYIVWSILALTVIITIWGIVSLLISILGLGNFAGIVCPDYDTTCNPSGITISPDPVQPVPPTDDGGDGGGVTVPGTDPVNPGGGSPQPPSEPTATDTPPTVPGVTGADYSTVGDPVVTRLQSTLEVPTYLSDEFEQGVQGPSITDDSRLAAAVSFETANLMSPEELTTVESEINTIRADAGYDPISADTIPPVDTFYTDNLSQVDSSITTSYTILEDNLTPLLPDDTELRNSTLLYTAPMFDTTQTLDARVEAAYDAYVFLSTTGDQGLATRDTLIDQFITTINIEIADTGMNNGIPLTREDVTGG